MSIKAPEAGTIQLIVVTALITAFISTLFGVFGKRAAEVLLDFILRPIRFIRESIYRWIAPRNPLSISLRSYKRHVARSNLTRIENPVGPNLSVPLEYAFAPLKLISSDTRDTVDLFEHVARSYRCIVLGGPGTGKTTLMKSLVTSMLGGRSNETLDKLIPVFVVLRNLAKNGHSVKQAIISSFADYHFPGADRFVERALEMGKLLIVLDGLDEVGASREFVANEILRFCEWDEQQQHRNRIIVTCREYSYRIRDLQSAIKDIVRVEPFANHHMRIFLQGWPPHKGRIAMKLYGLIQGDRQLRDICRNPLLLTILTGLFLDTDSFELPTSRERFYKAAVDELLVQRPARRQIKQSFDPEDKRQVLERVALERLETAKAHEDPEELSTTAIIGKAAEILRNDFDPHALIKELVDINGIIRPANEESYTCAHRTIQEYFAAREARRTRRTREVVDKFGRRSELIEVLYFYCGLVNNIPAITSIIQAFANQSKWLEAGKCLSHSKESVEKELVTLVASNIRAQIRPKTDFSAALELLSSLAQRDDPGFEVPRRLFADAIDDLAEGYGEQGAAALESVLAASPEAAMKVIPSLLDHESQRWKSAAVQLLRDIGTDEALDRLVQLLVSPDVFVRSEAAKVLAGMVDSRHRDLRERASLLPDKRDADIWPLNKYFPSRLAIPISEALLNPEESKSIAIRCAVKAFRIKQTHTEASNRRFIKQWRHVPRDLVFQRSRLTVGRVLTILGIVLPISFLVSTTLVSQLGRYRGETLILCPRKSPVRSIQAARITHVSELSRAVVDDITSKFPPNATGWRRVLPWHWSVEPIIPSEKASAFLTVKGWVNDLVVDPYEVAVKAEQIDELSGLAANDKVSALRTGVDNLAMSLPRLDGSPYLVVNPSKEGKWSVLMLFLSLPLVIFMLRSIRSRYLTRLRLQKRELLSVSISIQIAMASIGLASLLFLFHRGTILLRSVPLIAAVSFVIAGFIVPRWPWPNNPLLKTILEFGARSDRNEKDAELSSE